MSNDARNALPDEPVDPRQALTDAVATAAPCVLRWTSVAGSDLLRGCRARSSDLTQAGYEVFVSADDGPRLAALSETGGKVMAAIRRGTADLLFVSRVLDARCIRADGVYTVRLSVPSRMVSAARRLTYRVEMNADDARDLSARVWQIDDGIPFRDRPLASRELACTLRDLSGGGTRMVLSGRHQSTVSLRTGERLRVEIRALGDTLMFDGRIREARPASDGRWLCGISFVRHAHDLVWRRDAEKLHHVLAELQRRAAIRRTNAA